MYIDKNSTGRLTTYVKIQRSRSTGTGTLRSYILCEIMMCALANASAARLYLFPNRILLHVDRFKLDLACGRHHLTQFTVSLY